MGAQRFDDFGPGTDLEASFTKVREQAAWDYGHAGYTGTIAEKNDVVLRSDKTFTPAEAREFADSDLDKDDHDKWGPAWAVKVKDDKQEGFLFYGYASS